MRAIALLFLCAGLACASKAIAPPAPTSVALDPKALAKGDVASILSVLSRPHQEMSSLFGPHQLNISIQSKLSREKDVVVDLQEDILLSVDPRGAVHIQSYNNQNEGFDAYLSHQNDSAIATRYGPLQPTQPNAVNQARNTALASVYANLEPLSPWLVFTPNGAREVAGKEGLLFSLDKHDAQAPKALDENSDKAWRATIEPELIAGELALDAVNGFLLFADFSLRYHAVRNEQTITLEINVKANLVAQGDAVPEVVVPEITPLDPRLRVEKERLDIIGKAALQQQKESQKKGAKPKIIPPTAPPVVKTPAPTPPAKTPEAPPGEGSPP